MSGFKDVHMSEDFFARNGIDSETTGEFLAPNWTQQGLEQLGEYGQYDGIPLEMVDHPNHYQSEDNTYEAINVIESWNLDFHCGSVVKYIARHKKKGQPKQDIEKAIWYLRRYLERL